MTRFARYALVLMVVAVTAAPAFAEKPQALLRRAIKAIGGVKKIEKFPAATFEEKGTYYGMGDGLPYSGKYSIQWPDRFLMEIEGVFTMCLDGDKGWVKGPNGVVDMNAEQLASQQQSHYVGWVSQLVPLRDKQKYKLTAVEGGKVDGRATVGFKVESKGHAPVTLHFDQESALLVKTETEGKTEESGGKVIPQVNYYRAYKDFNGLKVATKMELHHDGKKFVEAEVVHFQAKEKIDENVFAKPEN